MIIIILILVDLMSLIGERDYSNRSILCVFHSNTQLFNLSQFVCSCKSDVFSFEKFYLLSMYQACEFYHGRSLIVSPNFLLWEYSRVDDKWIVQIRHDSPSLYMKYLVDFASLRKNFEKSNKQFFWRIGKFPKIGWKIAKLFLFQIIFSVKKLKNQVHFPSISISSRSTLKKISLFSPIFANISSNSIP